MRVLLATHALLEPQAPKYFSVGLFLLRQAVAAASDLGDVQVDVLDVSVLDQGYPERVLAGGHDVVGLSCQCWNLRAQLAVAEALKAARPGTTVLLGGHSAAAESERILRQHPSVDGVAMGEGEVTLVEALRALRRGAPLAGVPGLSTRLRPAVPLATSVASPPLPFASPHRPLSSYYLLESMRGCVYACDYCSWWVGERKTRYYPDTHVEANLRVALESGYPKVWLIDSAINWRNENLARLAACVRRVDPKRQLKFWYFVQWDRFSPRQLEHLEAFGPDTLHVGMESANPEVLRAMGRAWDRARFEECVGSLRQIATPVVDLVLGLPGDTPESFQRTLDYVVELGVNVLCFRLVVYPGIALERRREELGLKLRAGLLPYVLETPTFPREELDSVEQRVASMAYFDPKRGRYFLYEPPGYWEGGAPLVRNHGSPP